MMTLERIQGGNSVSIFEKIVGPYLYKRLWFVKYCMVESIQNPFGTVTCNLPNPGAVTTSSIPWWGSGLLIVMGIVSWIISAVYNIGGLSEAARLLVYVPLGNLFGMTQVSLSMRNNSKTPNGG